MRWTRRFRRIVVRLGFEPQAEQPRRSVPRQIGDVIFVLLLVLASNPMGLRRALRGYQSRVYLSRAVLQIRYGSGARGGRPGRESGLSGEAPRLH